jgi:hypothetical protein
MNLGGSGEALYINFQGRVDKAWAANGEKSKKEELSRKKFLFSRLNSLAVASHRLQA